jgi:hypothetical protein
MAGVRKNPIATFTANPPKLLSALRLSDGREIFSGVAIKY